MTKLYALTPEVAGGWGAGTIITNRLQLQAGVAIIPEASQLEYRFDGWMGDELLNFQSTYIVTTNLAALIEQASLTGYNFAPVKTFTSDVWKQFGYKIKLPVFRRLVPIGSVKFTVENTLIDWSGHDFCMGIRVNWTPPNLEASTLSIIRPYSLVVSERCLNTLQKGTLNHCKLEEVTEA